MIVYLAVQGNDDNRVFRNDETDPEKQAEWLLRTVLRCCRAAKAHGMQPECRVTLLAEDEK